MKQEEKQKNKKFLHKHGLLMFDAALVFLPFVVPHLSLPVAILCAARILHDFHKSRKKEE